jgi:hypothetical protein
MDGGFEDDEPAPAPRRTAAKQPVHAPEDTGSAPVFGALLSSPAFQDMVRSTLLDILRSPEGEALVRRVVRKELDRR